MSAERGWIVDPPLERELTPPSHANKWYKMMGAAELLPETPQREHHTPGWLSEKGTGRSHFHPEPLERTYRPARTDL
jgi:hypothetical protein